MRALMITLLLAFAPMAAVSAATDAMRWAEDQCLSMVDGRPDFRHASFTKPGPEMATKLSHALGVDRADSEIMLSPDEGQVVVIRGDDLCEVLAPNTSADGFALAIEDWLANSSHDLLHDDFDPSKPPGRNGYSHFSAKDAGGGEQVMTRANWHDGLTHVIVWRGLNAPAATELIARRLAEREATSSPSASNK